jgi:hypothetical protein
MEYLCSAVQNPSAYVDAPEKPTNPRNNDAKNMPKHESSWKEMRSFLRCNNPLWFQWDVDWNWEEIDRVSETGFPINTPRSDKMFNGVTIFAKERDLTQSP